MIAIQLILIVGAVFVASTLLSSRAAQIRAWRKIMLLGLVAIAIVSILFPEITNDVAKLVGVGRGADLLLYLMVLAFVAFALYVYFRFKEMEQRITKLARKVAINEADREV